MVDTCSKLDATPERCAACGVRQQGMCGALSDLQLQDLSRHTTKAVYPAGTTLLSDADDITSYATIVRGVVKLIKILEDGRQQIVGLQFAPDLIGRLWGNESELTIEAASEVELCRVPSPVLEQMLERTPSLEHRLMKQSLRELDEARSWMVTLGRKTAGEKVACFLYLIAAHAESNDGTCEAPSGPVSFTLPLTRADIADFLGLTLETVSRQMSKLRLDGVIELTGSRNVHVPSAERLHARCG